MNKKRTLLLIVVVIAVVLLGLTVFFQKPIHILGGSLTLVVVSFIGYVFRNSKNKIMLSITIIIIDLAFGCSIYLFNHNQFSIAEIYVYTCFATLFGGIVFITLEMCYEEVMDYLNENQSEA